MGRNRSPLLERPPGEGLRRTRQPAGKGEGDLSWGGGKAALNWGVGDTAEAREGKPGLGWRSVLLRIGGRETLKPAPARRTPVKWAEGSL